MTAKKSPADTSVPRTSTPRISEEELQRRIAVFRARGVSRIAGPDDPIYRSGLRMTSVRRSKASAKIHPCQPNPIDGVGPQAGRRDGVAGSQSQLPVSKH